MELHRKVGWLKSVLRPNGSERCRATLPSAALNLKMFSAGAFAQRQRKFIGSIWLNISMQGRPTTWRKVRR